MLRSITLPLAVLCITISQAQDGCSTAIPITAGTHVVDGVNGPEIPDPDCIAISENVEFSEWYRYTPAADLALKITTDLPMNGGLDPRFHVYTGSCGALVCVGGDDDSGSGYLAVDSLNVTGGVTYTIAFDDRWSESGFTFQLIEGPTFVAAFNFTSVPNATEGRVLAAVDMDHDNLDDIVTIDSTRVLIHFQQAEGGFDVSTFTTTEADNEPSWSLCAGDLDANGHNDLLYGGGSGVTFMMANDGGTGFTEVSYPQYVFSQRSNMVDINNDGNLDAFVCHDVDPNVYYMNDGTGNLTYTQGGLGDTPDGGNYGSIWIDFDGDRDLDLFIAKCRGGGQNEASIDQLHRNNGDGTFTEIAAAMNLADFQQSWSAAWGDYDRDGDLDVMIGASSLSQGGHKLMRNDGTTFTNVTIGSGLEAFTGTTNEWTTHDFNNDGRLDILGGAALHLGTGDLTFELAVSATNGPIGDLNDDGFLDILGGTSIRYANPNTNNWLKVNTIGTTSNVNGIGARVVVTSALGTQIRDVKSGDGFRYMSSLITHFGLGPDGTVEEVRVLWPSGLVSVLENVDVNTTLDIVEGVNNAIPEANAPMRLGVFPNPAQDLIYLTLPGTGPITVSVFDLSGKRVLEQVLQTNALDISTLSKGLYLLTTQSEGRTFTGEFTKL